MAPSSHNALVNCNHDPHPRGRAGDSRGNKWFFMPPTLKKWGTYWFQHVRVCVCVCLFVCVCGEWRYRFETSCMDSSWKNSRRIFLVFPEFHPLVKLRPFDKQRDEIL